MATPRQWRRRRRFSLFALTVVGALVVAAVAFGAVHTDQYYYNAGDTVQIAGDGMNANESVTVDVTYPDTTLAQEHVVAADASGNFADSYTIRGDNPGGVYTVTAIGQESGSIFTTTFDPPAITTTSINLPANVTYGDSFTFSGSVTYSGGNVGSTGQVEVQENRNNDSSCASPTFAAAGDIGTDTSLSSGDYSVGPLAPATFNWPTTGNITSFTAGNYYVKLGLSVGTYGFNAHYSGGTPTYAASDSSCKLMTVQTANTSATGSAPASITLGDSFNVGWTVGSTHGVTGNTATGTITISEQSKPASSSFGCTPASRAVSAAQTTGTGFSQSGSGGSGSTGFTCTPDKEGTYTFKIHFADTDGNYNNTDSSLVTVLVNPAVSYVAEGFYAPVDSVNKAKAGQTIPLKWNLWLGSETLENEVIDPTIGGSHYNLTSTLTSCSLLGTNNDPPVDGDAGASGLRYSYFDTPTATAYGQDIYAWQTNKGWANTCRTFTVTYDGFTVASALFQFAK